MHTLQSVSGDLSYAQDRLDLTGPRLNRYGTLRCELARVLLLLLPSLQVWVKGRPRLRGKQAKYGSNMHPFPPPSPSHISQIRPPSQAILKLVFCSVTMLGDRRSSPSRTHRSLSSQCTATPCSAKLYLLLSDMWFTACGRNTRQTLLGQWEIYYSPPQICRCLL